jgi:hypothetical protein
MRRRSHVFDAGDKAGDTDGDTADDDDERKKSKKVKVPTLIKGTISGQQDDGSFTRPKKKNDTQRTPPALPPLLALAWVAALLLGARWSVLYNVPPPLPVNASLARFAEDRAMVHVYQLSEGIGIRAVGTHNLERAERYVAAEARALVRTAKETLTNDLDVDFLLHRTTGSFRHVFLNSDIANAYSNLTNLAVRVAPKGMGLLKKNTKNTKKKNNGDDEEDFDENGDEVGRCKLSSVDDP